MAVDVKLLERLNADRALASQVLFSHRHGQESAPMHFEMFDLWRSADEFILIEAFREGGKTTTAEEHVTLEGCFGNFPYLLLIGETYTKACQRLEAIDYECRTNIRLSSTFGGAVLARKSIENKVWFKSGAIIECAGWEQELSGFKSREFRPTHVWLDDIENLERVRDGSAVDAGMRKLYLELIPAMDKRLRRLRFSQIRRAEDCMVTRLAANPEWVYRGYPICDREPEDPQAISLWPARYPMEWIRREKAAYEGANMLPEFLQSYMLQTVDKAAKPFKAEQFGEIELGRFEWMPKYAIYDPSRTSRERATRLGAQSDKVGKVVCSRFGSKIIVHESGGYFWRPSQLIEDCFQVDAQHHPVKIGVEKNSLDEWLLEPIRIEMLKRGQSFPLVPLQAPQDRSKDEFIMGLQPFFAAGDIVLVGGRSMHKDLVSEAANFPQGGRDVLNSLAYFLRLVSGVPVYEAFSASNIFEAPRPKSGEVIHIAMNASPNETVAVVVVKEKERFAVASDHVAAGAIGDAVKRIILEIRAAHPGTSWNVYAPPEIHDQWQRIPLVPALRQQKISPYRGAHVAQARGSLSTRIKTVAGATRMLSVDRKAPRILNALMAGYAYGALAGGRTTSEPEAGVSRLLAEALESMLATIDAVPATATGLPEGARVGVGRDGKRFISARR